MVVGCFITREGYVTYENLYQPDRFDKLISQTIMVLGLLLGLSGLFMTVYYLTGN